MITLLIEKFGINVYILTVLRCLKKLNITYKRRERINSTRDKDARLMYVIRII